MKIISAYRTLPNGKTEKLPADQIEKDRAELEKQHKIALAKEATWGFFGGTIRIGKNHYQVC